MSFKEPATGISSRPLALLCSTGPLRDKLAHNPVGIFITEQYSEKCGSFTDTSVLFEDLGRSPVPDPHLASAVLSALTVLEGGTEVQTPDWLPPSR